MYQGNPRQRDNFTPARMAHIKSDRNNLGW